jgi:23S rRNA (uracil1939-C5)-methyltransferase
MARDLAPLLAAGYALEKLVMIDLFPHTYHIESVAKLRLIG